VNDDQGVPLFGAALTGGLASPLTATYPFSFSEAARWLRERLTRNHTPQPVAGGEAAQPAHAG
jgi:hypothetical protein